MARRVFVGFEAVAAMVPTEGGYYAAIAVKGLGAVGAPTFHKVLDGEVFKSALAADAAANGELERLQGVTADAQLVW
ncbi:MAG TPA: hypothetical protein DIT18_04570 [Pseudomonas sp.]|jgi:hypothetical protein|nr:hypothetical protein [Pseudomonas sp.]